MNVAQAFWSLLFETTRRYFRPRYMVLAIAELSRTITRFHQMMITLSMPCGHFRQFVKTVNHKFRLKFRENVWNVRMAWTTLSSFDEISRGLGNIHHFDAISTGLGNIIIVLMPSSDCSENSTIALTTLRGLKRSVATKNCAISGPPT